MIMSAHSHLWFDVVSMVKASRCADGHEQIKDRSAYVLMPERTSKALRFLTVDMLGLQAAR